MSFKPSCYQLAVFDLLGDPNSGSFIVDAVAGSGKTSTIVAGLSHVPAGRKILMLAFNKSIAEELKNRVPNDVTVATFHSVGFRAWMRYCGRNRPRLKTNKTWKLIDNLFPGRNMKEEKDLYSSFIHRMVGLAKNAGIGSDLLEDTYDNWADLMEHHDVQPQNPKANVRRGLEYAQQVLEDSRHNKFEIDFDDMLYMPLIYGCQFQRYDDVFIDEAQDTNSVQRALLEAMITRNGRLIAVGDPCQAIYGFRGAESDAMERIENEFGCETRPLSISYRCSKKVVEEAQKVVPHIEAFENAEEGTVTHMDRYTPEDFHATDAIICRNVAPIVGMAYGFIRRGVGVQVLGREIGTGLVNLIRKLNAKDIDSLEESLEVWETRELEKAVEQKQERKAAGIEDKCACVRVFIENLTEDDRTIDRLIKNIENLFQDGRRGLLTLCSIHKAKGLEWDRVFFLDEWRIPSKWAKRDWMKQQENNLRYVAITRAKRDLVYISANCWKQNV